MIAGLVEAQNAGDSPDALLAKFKSPDHRIRDVAFSPDGKLVAAGFGFSEEGGIRIWNAADGSVVVTLLKGTKAESGIPCIAFSPDGNLFAAANQTGDVILWTVGKWRKPTTIMSQRGSPTDLNFSTTGTKLGITTEDVAVIYDLRTAKKTVLATNSNSHFSGISFAPDGKLVAVSNRQETWLIDVETGKRLGTWRQNSFNFFVRFSPDGSYLIAGGGPVFGKKSIQIWSVSEKKQLAELSEFKGGVFSLGISQSGKLFAVAGGDYGDGGYLSLWNLEDGNEVGFISFGEFPIKGLAFNHDDSVLAAGSEDGFVLLYAVDRIRGGVVKNQAFPLCGEIMIEGNRAFVIPLAKVPLPMRDFALPWKLEIANAHEVAGLEGLPVVLKDWSIESRAGNDRGRVKEVKSLLSRARSNTNSDFVVFGYVRNPGWDQGFVVKIYGDGSFVASDNSGKCRSYGSLDQLQTDFESVRKRLVASGLMEIARSPLTLGTDHYGTRFIELTVNGVTELRSDADSFEILLKGGRAKKREAFSLIFDPEEPFITSLLSAGMKPPN